MCEEMLNSSSLWQELRSDRLICTLLSLRKDSDSTTLPCRLVLQPHPSLAPFLQLSLRLFS